MDQESEIINTNTRLEKFKSFLINNKKSLTSFIIILILILFGYFFYTDYTKKQKTKLADRYNIVQMNYISGNKINAVNELKSIIMSKDKTYSPLALYFIIDNSLIESTKEINKFFDIIINDTKLDKEVKNLIIYKKALYNSEFETEINLINILKPLLNSESVWKSHALLLMGDFFYSKGEKKKSKEFYLKITNLKIVNQNILLEAQKKIRRDFND
tara:strand:- start:285 stop:929 length:645 start_codon:yes stop_codon:yes gene_type:complete